MKEKIKNAYYLLLPIILGSLVGFIINSFIDYPVLNKPPFAPPKVLFPIIWSIIYLLMGISYYLYRKKTNEYNYLYYIQLGVNLLWSIIFFVFKLRLLAVLWIILLDVLVYLLIVKFKQTDKTLAYLNIPYLIWALYATYLTIGIYILN